MIILDISHFYAPLLHIVQYLQYSQLCVCMHENRLPAIFYLVLNNTHLLDNT